MKKTLAMILAIVMVFALCGNAFAAHLTDEVTELEAANSDTSMEIAAQSYVLLENNGALPLRGEKKVALFGSGSEYTIKGGTGSGDVNQRSRDHIGQAFEAAGYEIADPTWFAKMAAQQVTSGCMGASPKVDMEITDEELAEAVGNTDTAIYVIARNAGEGSDREVSTGNGSYMLTELELTNIEKLANSFDNFIVVYNTCVMDTSWQADFDIDAIVFMGNGGQRGSEALVKCLTGEINFSGKLTDTWPMDYYDYPTSDKFSSLDGNTNTEWFEDGIYVGYRYFDTFGLDVKYEFGYGLSYTDFDISVENVTADADQVSVDVAVANIGDVSGKEVVQVYFSAPQVELEKPYQELAAYAKTDELQPCETQTLTIHFDTADMSSYSEELAAYVMEAGDYIIRVGNSSRNTVAAARIVLDEDVITEQLSNQMTLEPGAVLEEISNADATPIANNDEAELAAAPVIELAAADFPEAPNNASTNDEETITTYLFAADAEGYEARKGITLRTKTIAGVIDNAEYPNGDGGRQQNQFNGYRETTYDEVVEIVPDLPEGITKETAKLTDVLHGDITLEQFVACLTADEMARLCVGGAGTILESEDGQQVGAAATSVQGGAGQTTYAYIETRHIPSMPNADGPAGCRITQHYTKDDVDYYQFATAFPVGTNIAQTWDVDLIEEFGKAYGSEMKEYGITTCLCPGMNIHRNALCGRNFEYYSEDPLVTGLCAAYFTIGVQSYNGIGVSLKHYFANDQENNRNSVNNVMSERASREIDLRAFEIAVKLAQPMTVMDCYQENNGWSGSNDWDKDEDILRGEWGFKGYVMTDWGGGQSLPHFGKHAGCDVVMPGNGNTSTILNYYYSTDPTFNEDGSIRSQGDFVFDPDQGEPPTYEVTTTATSNSELPESVQNAIAEGYAKFWIRGTQGYVGWYGHLSDEGKICLGDIQKSAMRVLNVAMQSQDMEVLMEALGEELDVGSYSEGNGALLSEGWSQSEKGDVTEIDALIIAGSASDEDVVDGQVTIDVTSAGAAELTTVRLALGCDLAIAAVDSDYDFEFNPAINTIIVYDAQGAAIGTPLFTVTFTVPEDAEGDYPVAIELIEVTGADGELIDALSKDGVISLAVAPVKGDVNGDGAVDNRDLIMIARYLVDLEEFDDDQMILADYNEDGAVNNTDLVLISRAMVE